MCSSDLQPATLALALPAGDVVAVRTSAAIGDHAAGSILIGERLAPADAARAHGRECIVAFSDGKVRLGRVAKGRAGPHSLKVPTGGGAMADSSDVAWVAPIGLAVRAID